MLFNEFLASLACADDNKFRVVSKMWQQFKLVRNHVNVDNDGVDKRFCVSPGSPCRVAMDGLNHTEAVNHPLISVVAELDVGRLVGCATIERVEHVDSGNPGRSNRAL